MMRSLSEVVSQFKRNWTRVIGNERIEGYCRELGVCWRNRLLNPARTTELFLLQILHGNTAISHLRLIARQHFTESAYCQARSRLPLLLLKKLLAGMSMSVKRSSKEFFGLWCGRRTYLVDGSSFSMPDTLELRNHFGYPPRQKDGCGFPTAHFLALFHVGTGMILEVLSGALFSHDLSQFIKLHPKLEKGDVVVGDRGFCSYTHLAVMARRGVDAVFRLHQRHIVNFRSGRKHSAKGKPRSRWDKKLGIKDQLVTWFKPKSIPWWMNAQQYRLIPATLQVRELAYTVNKKGYRSQKIVIVTTLLDHQQFPPEEVSTLYGQRWMIETNFKHLKSTMKMDVLHCKTVEGVLKEFYAFCIVFNLVRTVMLEAAKVQNCSPHEISFIDALRWLLQSCHRPLFQQPKKIIPRSGRSEPRVKKRRPNQYKLLNKPRHFYKIN